MQTQDWKCACAGLKEKREISWRSAVEAEEAMNKVGEQSKSPTFGFGCKPGGEETRSVLVEKVAEEKAGSNRRGEEMIEMTKMPSAYLRMHAESRTCFAHYSLSLLLYYWGRAVQLQREKEKRDGTDRGTTEMQSAYLTTHLVLVVTDYSMSSCCMFICRAKVLSESWCCLIRVSTNLLERLAGTATTAWIEKRSMKAHQLRL